MTNNAVEDWWRRLGDDLSIFLGKDHHSLVLCFSWKLVGPPRPFLVQGMTLHLLAAFQSLRKKLTQLWILYPSFPQLKLAQTLVGLLVVAPPTIFFGSRVLRDLAERSASSDPAQSASEGKK